MGFCKDFTWGAATASFQIEGGYDERGENIWDMFCRKPGAVAFGHDGKVACDHYRRYKEDIAILKTLGIKSYRFSLSWSRLFKNGLGEINPKGVEFYNNLINELIKNDIEPYITLFHWDYPLALYRKGGWLNPDSPKWFEEYTKRVVELFSDRVSHWFTLNETLCFISLGHANGEHAPGVKLSEEDVMIMAHNALLSHGLAVRAIRANAKLKPSIGYAPVGEVKIPASNSEEDIKAAYNEMFKVYTPHYWGNMIWVDPLFTGKYDDEILDVFKKYHIAIGADDMKIISEPIDFLGMNIYMGTKISAGGAVKSPVGFNQTAMNWEISPEALYWGPKFYYERYKIPVYITENGMANNDVISADNCVHDPQRIEFLRSYISNLKRAVDDGVDVRGYFHWSLMDNFEWAEGYQKRFGLVYIDYPTQKRIIKDSGYWYKKVIETNGENL